ncbi:glycosyltransferase family 2 protein, partial [bacterium]|nr:glycosyltransferase family 2 protein [bacterium]
MDVSFVIVNWNTAGLLENCINSIFQTVNRKKFEIIVVDNASSDESVKLVETSFPDVTLIKNSKNLGFARAVNKGIRVSCGKYVLLLNTDTLLQKNAVCQLVDYMDSNKKAGISGGQLMYKDGRKQNSFDNYPSLLFEIFNKSLLKRMFPRKFYGKLRNFDNPVEVDSVIGACFVISRSCIDDIGLLDEDYFFFIEETDYCYRAGRKG